MVAEASSRIQICGRIEAQIRGRRVESELRGRQGRLLFVYLVVHRHRPVSRDELIEALWPRGLPSDPAAVLRSLLSRLRHALGAGALQGTVELTLLLPEDAAVDLEAAAEAVSAAEAACAASRWRAAWDAAGAAVAVAGRGFLPGEDAPWVAECRLEVEDVRLRALECLARAGIRLGAAELSAAERAARSLIEAAPFREAGYLFLMEAQAARGGAAEALRVHDTLRVLLRDELGAAPGAEVQALHERLLKGEARPRPPDAVPGAGSGRGACAHRGSSSAAVAVAGPRSEAVRRSRERAPAAAPVVR